MPITYQERSTPRRARFEVYEENPNPKVHAFGGPKNILIYSSNKYADVVDYVMEAGIAKGFVRDNSGPNKIEHEIQDGEIFDY